MPSHDLRLPLGQVRVALIAYGDPPGRAAKVPYSRCVRPNASRAAGVASD